jgi:hypothetical protein
MIMSTARRDKLDFVDEYGTRWIYYTDDGNGNYAIQNEDDAKAAIASGNGDGTYHVTALRDGDTFGVNCTDEFIVECGQWTTNDHAEYTIDEETNQGQT